VNEVEELVSRAALGDAEAWAALVDRFAGLIWHIARTRGLDPIDAADISQTTWLRFAEHLGSLREPGRAGAWLATTAKRESIRVARLAGRQVVVDPWLDLRRAEGEDPDADAAMIAQEQSIAVQLALAELPARCRDLLLGLVGDPPCSYAELSARLGLPVGSIGPTRARCLDRLRALLVEKESPAETIATGWRSQ
jgi:RNA polymerase sigma factor (sigma-70 family)